MKIRPLDDFAAVLCQWQRAHGRHDLPWQQPKFEPYRVWISEIMLQQTQVQTVCGYFERFMARWPNLMTLANAHEDEVLQAWSGLGYYRRARHLYAAAIQMAETFGQVPDTLDALMALPGVGRSTAGAILSLGFNQSAPILDGNVKRVFARLHGVSTPPNERATEKALWQLADHYVQHDQPGAHNQALMDLGATLCTPKHPSCLDCPFQSCCHAHQHNMTTILPKSLPKKPKKKHTLTLFLVQYQDVFWLTQRPSDGLWAKYWCFPEATETWRDGLFNRLQHDVDTCHELPPFSHQLTHIQFQIQPIWLICHTRPRLETLDSNGHWFDIASFASLALPKPVEKCLKALAAWQQDHEQ